MTLFHLVRVTPFIAVSLLWSEGALAQTPTFAAQSSAVNVDDSAPATSSERFRVHLPSKQAVTPRTTPGPWMSMVPSDPFALRGPSFQSLHTVPFSVQAAPPPAKDPVIESKFVARRTVGGVLLGLSSPFLVTGGYLIAEFSGLTDPSNGVGTLVGIGGVFLGVTSFLIGVGLFIPGLVYTLTDPPGVDSALNYHRPTLQLRPDGVGLSMKF